MDADALRLCPEHDAVLSTLAAREEQEEELRACLRELAAASSADADATLLAQHVAACARELPHLAASLACFSTEAAAASPRPGDNNNTPSQTTTTTKQSARRALLTMPPANPRPFGVPQFAPCRRVGEVLVECACDIIPFEVLEFLGTRRGVALAHKYYRRCHFGYLSRGFEVSKTPDGGWSAPDDAREVAVKTVSKAEFEAYEAKCRAAGAFPAEDPYRAAAAISFLAHRTDAVVPLLGCYADDEHLYLPAPFCRGGDLRERLVASKQPQANPSAGSSSSSCSSITEAAIQRAFSRLVERVAALHSLGVAHNDLSLDNVVCLYDDDDSAHAPCDDLRLIDLAMSVVRVTRRPLVDEASRLLGRTESAASSRTHRLSWPRCGKALYAPPDVLRGSATCDVFACDAFALGVCLFILLVGAPPCQDCAQGCVAGDPVYRAITDGRLRPLLAGWGVAALSDACLDVVSGLLREDPDRRLTVGDALRHPWVAGARASSSSTATGLGPQTTTTTTTTTQGVGGLPSFAVSSLSAEGDERVAAAEASHSQEAASSVDDDDDDVLRSPTRHLRYDDDDDDRMEDDVDDDVGGGGPEDHSVRPEVWELVLPPQDLDLGDLCGPGGRVRSPPATMASRDDDDDVTAETVAARRRLAAVEVVSSAFADP